MQRMKRTPPPDRELFTDVRHSFTDVRHSYADVRHSYADVRRSHAIRSRMFATASRSSALRPSTRSSPTRRFPAHLSMPPLPLIDAFFQPSSARPRRDPTVAPNRPSAAAQPAAPIDVGFLRFRKTVEIVNLGGRATVQNLRRLLPLPLPPLRRTARHRQPPKQPRPLLLLPPESQRHRSKTRPRALWPRHSHMAIWISRTCCRGGGKAPNTPLATKPFRV